MVSNMNSVPQTSKRGNGFGMDSDIPKKGGDESGNKAWKGHGGSADYVKTQGGTA